GHPRPQPRLRGDHHLVPRDQVVEQRADHRLRLAVAVHVGRVEQVAAGVAERLELRGRVVRIGVAPPGHRAQCQPGHGEPAATLDAVSGGRFRLGLGVSGPQVSEGWHGVRFSKPLARTREYVDIVKLALARREVSYAGEHYTLPLPDGPGKALKLMLHPVRD